MIWDLVLVKFFNGKNTMTILMMTKNQLTDFLDLNKVNGNPVDRYSLDVNLRFVKHSGHVALYEYEI